MLFLKMVIGATFRELYFIALYMLLYEFSHSMILILQILLIDIY
jgi:hypothetical protein